MKTIICFIVMVTISVAKDGDVYVYNTHDFYYAPPGTKRIPVFESGFPWKFEFISSDQLYMRVIYFNKSPSVTSVIVTYGSDLETVKGRKVTLSNGKTVPVIVRKLRAPKSIVNLNLYTSHGLCTSLRVAEGTFVSTVRPEKTEKEYKYTDICLEEITRHCVLVVNLKDFICKGSSNTTQKDEDLKTTTPLTSLENNNTTYVSNVSSASHGSKNTSTNSSARNTETNNQQSPPHNNVLIYVIPSVMGMCVVMLVIYVTVKKYCLRNSSPVDTMELNTYATVNEVIYADLNMMHGVSQPPRRDEESPYAEIIGVLHPH